MEPLLTADEVARILNVKVSTIYDGVYRGLLPAIRVWKGRRRSLIRFSGDDLKAFIVSKRTRGQSASGGR